MSASEPTLRRALTLPWLVLYGMGTTIGAGIYALTGVVAEHAGLLAPACFLLASVIALFSALSFAELASRFPRAGGEVVFVQEGFGHTGLSRAVGLLVVAAGLISAATISVALAGYLADFVSLPRPLIALATVALIGGLASWGIRESVMAAGIMTLIEVGGLLAIVAFGGERLGELPLYSSELVPWTPAAWHAVGAAAVLAFYAFLGFEDLVNVAEETRDVRRVMPLAIVITLLVTTLLYVVVAFVAVTTVPPAELGEADAPLVLVFERLGGSGAALGVIALFALLNGALIQIMKAARVVLGMARGGMLPKRLGRVHARTRTPVFATIGASVGVAALAALFPLATLARATSSITLVTFALANLALLLVKRRERPPPGALSLPAWVPAVGLALDLALLGFAASTHVT